MVERQEAYLPLSMRCGDDIQIDPDQAPPNHGDITSIPPRQIGSCGHSAMNRRARNREFLQVLPRGFDRTAAAAANHVQNNSPSSPARPASVVGRLIVGRHRMSCETRRPTRIVVPRIIAENARARAFLRDHTETELKTPLAVKFDNQWNETETVRRSRSLNPNNRSLNWTP